jgi:recombination protein RecA
VSAALRAAGPTRGRIVEVCGPDPDGWGKTAVALRAVADAQAAGGRAAYIGTEQAPDPQRVAALGVDAAALVVHRPATGVQAVQTAERLVRSGGFDVVVVDSAAALAPPARIAGVLGPRDRALQARLMSHALRRLAAAVGASATTVVVVNRIGGGPPEATAGRALEVYAAVRLDARDAGASAFDAAPAPVPAR